MLQTKTDYRGGGAFALEFSRYYSSGDHLRQSHMGINWRHMYDRTVLVLTTDFVTTATLVRPNGDELFYSYDAQSSSWIGDPDVPGKLAELKDPITQNRTGWTYTNEDGETETYDANGLLVTLTNRDGLSHDLVYNVSTADGGDGDSETLDKVVDRLSQRALILTYDVARRLTKVTVQQTGDQYQYQYVAGNPETSAKLVKVIYPDPGAPFIQYVYDEANHFPAGTSLVAGSLTGIIDENNSGNATPQRFADFTYSDRYHASVFEYAPGAFPSGQHVGKVQLQNYSATYGSTVVTDANGQARTFQFEIKHGVARLNNVNGPQCPACGGSLQNAAYDVNGYPQSKKDFNGNTTIYGYPDVSDAAKGLEQCRIEGIPAPPSTDKKALRLTKTAWNAPYRVPALISVYEPAAAMSAMPTTCPLGDPGTDWVLRKQTQYDYVTGSGRVQTKTERSYPQDTYDPPRVTQYSYYPDGDPRAPLLYQISGPNSASLTTYDYYTSNDTSGNGAYRIGDPKTIVRRASATLDLTTHFNAYTGDGRPTVIVDPNGVETDLTYKPRGWLWTKIVAGQMTTYSYDAAGQLTGINIGDTAGNSAYATTYSYDPAHRLTDIYDALGNSIHYTLDNLGNRTREETRGAGLAGITRQIDRGYTALNRLDWVTRSTSAGPATTYFPGYDNNGNVTQIVDPRDPDHIHPTIYSVTGYDALNRKTHLQDNAGQATDYAYDVFDNVKSITDPNGNAATPKISTTYLYNGFGDLRQVTSPDTGVTSYRYDTAGNRVSQTDARTSGQGNLTVTYEYDALNRLHKVNYPTAGTVGITLDYDENNAGQNGRGRLTSVSDETGATVFKYDARGNVREKAFTFAGDTSANVTSYTYSSADQLWTMTYPSQRVVTYVRNGMGQVTGITTRLPWEQTETQIVSQGTYEPFGPLHGWTYGGNPGHQITATETHDQSYRIQRQTHGTVVDSEYTIDVADNVRHIHDYLLSGNDSDFSYDVLDRLTNAQIAQNTAANYQYDFVGNRTRETVANEIYSYYTDPANKHLNWLNTNQPGSGPTASSFSRTYDQVGNLSVKTQMQPPAGASAEWFVYGYADNSRLAWMIHSDNANNQEYQVSAHNWKGVPVGDMYGTGMSGPVSVVEVFHADEAGRPLTIIHSAGTASWAHEMIYFNDLPIAYYRYDANMAMTGPYYLHANHLGAPLKVTNADGATVVNLQYSAFGTRTVLFSAVDPPRLGLPGQMYTHKGWFVHNYFREYDPGTGRYLEPDPIGLAGGLNPYLYVGANPLRFADPTGLTRCDMEVARDIAGSYTGRQLPGLSDYGWRLPPAPGLGMDPGFFKNARVDFAPSNAGSPPTYKGFTGYDKTTKEVGVRVNWERYAPCLSEDEALDLLNTMIHEGVHWSLPNEHPMSQDAVNNGGAYPSQVAKAWTPGLAAQYLAERKKRCSCECAR